MVLDPELRAMMRQTIHVAEPLSKTPYGDNQLDEPSPMRAYVQHRSSVVNTPDGTELLSDVAIITEAPMSLHAMVWLPEADPSDETLARAVKSVAPITDEHGDISHFEVSL